MVYFNIGEKSQDTFSVQAEVRFHDRWSVILMMNNGHDSTQCPQYHSWKIPGMFCPTSEIDPLIVQNENCMNVQVRMFIECSELNAK